MNAVEDSFSEDLMVRLALFFGALLGIWDADICFIAKLKCVALHMSLRSLT